MNKIYKEIRFWNKIANKYSMQPIPNMNAYKKKLKLTQKYLNKNSVVLEIGCGTGSTAIEHAPHVNHITAIDISDKMIEISNEKIKKLNINNIKFIATTISSVELAKKQFDMVMAMSLIHLLRDRSKFIKDVKEYLKPNGSLVISTPCLSDSMPYLKIILPLLRFLGKALYVSFFTFNELQKLLRDNGFEIEYKWQPTKKEAWFIIAKNISKE